MTYGGRTLRRDTDYTLSYKNNTKVGTATITVRGKGKYTGTKTAAFKIYPSVRYYVHRQTYGWETTYGKRNGEQSGTTGQSKRLEGIRVKLSTSLSGSIQYRTHIQGIGWQGWRSDGKLSGTTGKSKRLEAIRIRLTGQMAQKYDVWYRVHAQRFGWMGWAKNGQSAGTEGYSYRLEAIQIVLKAKRSSAPAATYKGATRSTSAKFKKSYPIQTGTTYETADFKVTFPSSWKNRWSASKSSDGTYYTFDADSSGYSSIGVFGSEQTLTNTRAMRMIYCGRSSRGKYIYWYSPPMNSLFVRSGATITVK